MEGGRFVVLVSPTYLLNFSLFLQFISKNYGENPDNYNEQLKKLETLRQVSSL